MKKSVFGIKRIACLVLCLFLCSGLIACTEGEEAYSQGISEYQHGKYEKALYSYQLSQSQGNKDPLLYGDLALAYLKTGHGETAAEYEKLALENAPEHPELYKKLGMYYEELGKPEEALTYYQKSMTSPENAMNPGDLETCGFMGKLEKTRGNYEEAIRLYNLLIEQDYYRIEHQLMAGECYLLENQVAAACQYFDLIQNSDRICPEYYLTISKWFKDRLDIDHAKQYFEEGLQYCSEEEGMSVGEYYVCAEKYKEALDYLQEGSSLKNDLALAKAYIHLEEYEEAERIYQRMIQQGLNLPEVYNCYMVLESKMAEPDTALLLYPQIENSGDEEAEASGAWNVAMIFEEKQEYKNAYEKLLDYSKNFKMTDEMKKEMHFLKRAQ